MGLSWHLFLNGFLFAVIVLRAVCAPQVPHASGPNIMGSSTKTVPHRMHFWWWEVPFISVFYCQRAFCTLFMCPRHLAFLMGVLCAPAVEKIFLTSCAPAPKPLIQWLSSNIKKVQHTALFQTKKKKKQCGAPRTELKMALGVISVCLVESCQSKRDQWIAGTKNILLLFYTVYRFWLSQSWSYWEETALMSHYVNFRVLL